MSVSIFCIQFSPTIRFWSLTNGSRPQKVTKTLQRMPLAAAVDDRISTGQTLSSSPDQLMITSSLVLTGCSMASSVLGAGRPFAAAIAIATGSMTGVADRSGVMVVMACASLPAQDEAVDAAVR